MANMSEFAARIGLTRQIEASEAAQERYLLIELVEVVPGIWNGEAALNELFTQSPP
jgi:hypothetical protein